MKKWLVAFLAAVMVCQGGVAAMAAGKTVTAVPDKADAQQVQEAPYTVEVSKAKMKILQDGKVVNTYNMRSSQFRVVNGKEKGTVAVRFWDEDGKQRKINLGSMEELNIYGKMSKLTLSSQLTDKVKIVITKDCVVTDMFVNNAAKVSVYGTVKELDISNKKARVTEERKGEIREVHTVSDNAIKGVSSENISVYDPDEEEF